MGLLSPWFLAGVLAVGIPIWVHLIRREQAVRLPFSSLMFLRRIPIKSMSRKRLKYFFLLSMRMLIILLIALAFARPYFPWLQGPLTGPGSERFGVILLDTSMSMQYGDRWERALAAADEAVAGFRDGDEVQIVTFSSDFQILNLATADKAALRAALEQAEPTAAPTSYAQAFRAAERIAEDVERPLSVVLISDLQRAGLGTAAQLALPAMADFRIVNVAEGEAPNWTVEGVRSRRTVYRARYPDRLVVQLRGSGTPQITKEVNFSLLGKQIERKTVGIPASGVATVVFEGFDVPVGQNPAEISIGPADGLPMDDTFYFTLERREANRLLFLRESGADAELYYLRSALSAETDSPFLIEARSPADARSVPLREYAMVILSNVRQLPGAVVSELRDYVQQGGGLLITSGSNTTLALESQLEGLWPGKTLMTQDPGRWEPWRSTVTADSSLPSYNADHARFVLPRAVLLRQALAAGELPLWDPTSFMGNPFLALWQTQVLYPPNLLLLLVDGRASLAWAVVLHLLIAGLGMLYLGKGIGLSRPASLLGALVFTFGPRIARPDEISGQAPTVSMRARRP